MWQNSRRIHKLQLPSEAPSGHPGTVTDPEIVWFCLLLCNVLDKTNKKKKKHECRFRNDLRVAHETLTTPAQSFLCCNNFVFFTACSFWKWELRTRDSEFGKNSCRIRGLKISDSCPASCDAGSERQVSACAWSEITKFSYDKNKYVGRFFFLPCFD